MPEGLPTLLLYCALMAIASFAAGMLPLAVTLSQSQLRMISTVGMGVLVGTSMIVIIPEGIETIYSASRSVAVAMNPPAAGVQARSWDLGGGPDIWAREEQTGDGGLPATVEMPPHTHEHTHTHSHSHDGHTEEEEAAEEAGNPHKWIGLSLITGFILMYLIDSLPSHRHGADEPPYIAIDNLGGSMSPSPPGGGGSSTATTRPNSMTLGLVIHAAADGIALGASSASSNLALGAIIFIAIMLHKAPAAFGLTAVLLRGGGLGKRQVRTHLLVFSMAAPVGALFTWLVLGLLGGGGEGMQFWTGVLLLFSGGTFLYVAMHTMQAQAAQLQENGQKGTVKDVIAAVFGMVVPLATQIGHHHHH